VLKEKKIKIDSVDPVLLYGFQDYNLKLLSEEFAVKIIARGNEITLNGMEENVSMVEESIKELIYMIKKNETVSREDVIKVINLVKLEFDSAASGETSGKLSDENGDYSPQVIITSTGKIKPRSRGQQELIEAIKNNDIVFAIGPAGTGKTYLSVAMAVSALLSKEVLKIILARPAVEAGENLGFLPGDMKEKIEPYLRPLYDALNDMLPRAQLKKFMDQEIIEIIPLAYMRGRTLNNAFIILDEAQNATSVQMKMVLTRLGVNSKMVVNGDITQIDLNEKNQSGLVQIQSILHGIPGIRFIYLDKEDVVRHRLVRDIINAYSKYPANGKKSDQS
jgi:phosphate starvation-inducible PhoH-like protein